MHVRVQGVLGSICQYNPLGTACHSVVPALTFRIGVILAHGANAKVLVPASSIVKIAWPLKVTDGSVILYRPWDLKFRFCVEMAQTLHCAEVSGGARRVNWRIIGSSTRHDSKLPFSSPTGSENREDSNKQISKAAQFTDRHTNKPPRCRCMVISETNL
jgi:hypothetical protein